MLYGRSRERERCGCRSYRCRKAVVLVSAFNSTESRRRGTLRRIDVEVDGRTMSDVSMRPTSVPDKKLVCDASRALQGELILVAGHRRRVATAENRPVCE